MIPALAVLAGVIGMASVAGAADATTDRRHRSHPAPTRTAWPYPTTAAARTTTPAPRWTPTSARTRTPIGTPTPVRSPTSAPPATATNSDFAGQVIALTNRERAAAGCQALTTDVLLTRIALAHSVDMARNNYFAHNTQDGRSPFDRFDAVGYNYSQAAENIAAGQPSPREVMAAWMASPGHRENILDCGLTQIGVGYATSTSSTYATYWTQDFGTRMTG